MSRGIGDNTIKNSYQEKLFRLGWFEMSEELRKRIGLKWLVWLKQFVVIVSVIKREEERTG